MRLLLAFLILAVAAVAGYATWEILQKPDRPPQGAMAIRAAPLVLDSSKPERTMLGKLHFLGAWHLTGPDRSFGGLSSLQIMPDGTIWALSDSSILYSFPQPGTPGKAMVKWLPLAKPRPKDTRLPFDSESMVYDPASGRAWVGFELMQRICRYRPGFLKPVKCREWPEIKHWPKAASLESMARLPDGRFLVIAEGATGTAAGREALLFSGDPVADATPHPIRMLYVPPVGYDPTDAVVIGDGQLLVLNRRATVYDGFTAIITLVDISSLRPGAVLIGKEIARLAPPVLADNFEGLALERGSNGQRLLWVVSDDNHLFFERTLLLKFALPDHF
ncbi:MAG: esterase-like activity of phytase family protein [Sphingomonadales bacterium]|nr:MAG: esterase-like activity of phytase family protein [Sphingomonadales bacterium]TNF04183.1 MAG: esterase-like activity of phytase family protein [Sphingomonadales bacterium]